jgi:hypothetical protein
MKAAPQAPAPRLVVKRMHDRSQEDILTHVATAPSLMLDRTVVRAESKAMVRANLAGIGGGDATLALLARRADLAGLPLRRGQSGRLTTAEARTLEKAAGELQNMKGDQLAARLAADKAWLGAERIGALMQVLMVEPEASRVVLAQHLGAIKGKQASAALAQMVLFDPHPDVRREAITSLQRRRAAEYRDLLLRGFRSPWVVPAEHAAEALAALRRTETVPALLRLLGSSDPQAPYDKGNNSVRYVKELVRIDHKFNCLMCHPPSFRSSDPARRAVPPLRETVVGLGYFARVPQQTETLVRADVTYLKQDYSVILQVKRGGNQEARRFDLFIRERVATPADMVAALVRKKAGPTGHQKAIRFALRELTGQEPGRRDENWHLFAQRQNLAALER